MFNLFNLKKISIYVYAIKPCFDRNIRHLCLLVKDVHHLAQDQQHVQYNNDKTILLNILK